VRLAGVEAPRRAAPRLGEDTEAVLREGGFTPDEIATLCRDGVAAAAAP
jgi:crotonobetainyl-CoA:carnitine CoA-transferase CaiB-like acyl-CoA transferase